MFKVYIDKRYITISSQPDRLQNYCLFHKFNDQKDFSEQLSKFLEDSSIESINIYSNNLDHLWALFIEEFHFIEAAGGLVISPDRELLFIKRYNHWDAPKGHFEPSETPEECARREILEECGVSCGRRIAELRSTYHIYRFKNEYYLKHTYWFLFTLQGNKKTTPQIEEGISEASWINRESLGIIREGMWLSVKDVLYEVYSQHINHL